MFNIPHKYQVGDYLLSYSYDFRTRFSTGLIHGYELTSNYHQYELWDEMLFDEIWNWLQSVHHLWAHPLLLPVMLLQQFVHRVETFSVAVLDVQSLDIQRQLGVSRAGRLSNHAPFRDPVGQKSIQQTKGTLTSLIGEMSTLTTEVILFSRVTTWLQESNDFLIATLIEIRGQDITGSDEVLECLEHIRSAMRSQVKRTATRKELLNADFNVVCDEVLPCGSADGVQLSSVMSQIDNRLSAKMTATTSRDSTAMKALAFITAFFLPATAVAVGNPKRVRCRSLYRVDYLQHEHIQLAGVSAVDRHFALLLDVLGRHCTFDHPACCSASNLVAYGEAEFRQGHPRGNGDSPQEFFFDKHGRLTTVRCPDGCNAGSPDTKTCQCFRPCLVYNALLSAVRNAAGRLSVS